MLDCSSLRSGAQSPDSCGKNRSSISRRFAVEIATNSCHVFPAKFDAFSNKRLGGLVRNIASIGSQASNSAPRNS